MTRLVTAFVIFSVAITSGKNCDADIVVDGVGASIPDGDVNGFSSMIQVNDDENVTGVSIGLNGLTHSWVGDLVITLSGPDGSSVTIMDRTGEGVYHDSSDVTGNANEDVSTYVFADSGTDWVMEASMGGSGYVMRTGTYKASTSSGISVDMNPVFENKSSAGAWTLTVSDRLLGESGAFGGWTLTLLTNSASIPEPGALGVIGALSILVTMRRRRNT